MDDSGSSDVSQRIGRPTVGHAPVIGMIAGTMSGSNTDLLEPETTGSSSDRDITARTDNFSVDIL